MNIYSHIYFPSKTVLALFLHDEKLSEKLRYKLFTGETFDSDKGHTVATYSDTILRGIRLRHNARSVAVATANLQIGDPVFLFDGTDCPENMSLKDKIVDKNDVEMNIKAIDEIFDICKLVTVEAGGLNL